MKQSPPKRILLIRLDRLGDVVLSTPVLQALRRQFPHAFLAMLVRPPCREAVEGHQALDEVLVYDKEGAQRTIGGTIRFARALRARGFDTALVLHPSNRSHWIPWLAGIPRRIGYARKCAWLLTDRLPHRKQEGERHEAAYTLEMVRVFGMQPEDCELRPVISINPEAARRVEALLSERGVPAAGGPGGRLPLVAVHPSASCISKRWMPQRFAQVADRLAAEQGVGICVIGDGSAAHEAHDMVLAMRQPALNLVGQLSVGELAALLRRCELLLSNDSGPVHVAAAVATPVVDIFGRNQRGLSPTRWGPLGEGHIVLQRDVGCVTCLAHQCDIDFLCLTSLSAEEVYEAAVRTLQKCQSL